MNPTYKRAISALTALLLAVAISLSQPRGQIEIVGRVLDDSTSAPLQNVDVFLAHTTWGSGTDQSGHFRIANISAGTYELTASRIGYFLRSFQISITDSGKKEYEIRLRPSSIGVEAVDVSAADPKEWREQLKRFTMLFLGKSENARQCRILNPEVIDFKTGEAGFFEATARAPLEIDNLALGYHVRFFLSLFRVGTNDEIVQSFSHPDILSYEGLPEYSEMRPSTAEEERLWKENRTRTYKGSLRHFLTALTQRNVEKEGFVMCLTPRITGVILEKPDPATSMVRYGDGSTWSPDLRPVVEDDIVTSYTERDEFVIQYKGYLQIEYSKATIEPGYDSLVRKGSDTRVSWLLLRKNSISVDSSGLIKDRFPMITYGYWAWERMADSLPLDFEPGK